jgi:hypothetical protein
MQPLLAITALTWKAAFRFRLFLVIAVLLLASVVGLPLLIKDDGTARGFTQILLTYTLSTISVLLGFSTLWLACGLLSREIEDCQLQMVVVKPVARWQIWFGKWLGIMSLNAVLLALAGGTLYGLLQWRATRLPADEQKVLRNEVLIARGSIRPPGLDKEIDEETSRRVQERLQKYPVSPGDVPEVVKNIRGQVKAEVETVPPGVGHLWEIDLGLRRHLLRGQPLHLRIKFNSADKSPSGTFLGILQVGVPRKTRVWRSEVLSLAPDTFHEVPLPPDLFDENGILTVQFGNLPVNGATLLFPLEDGLEVLYPEGGFALNYIRGLGIIFCWIALLATLGLASSSFFSFPVAAFFSLAMLFLVLCSATMANVVSEGTIADYDAAKSRKGSSPADIVILPVFKSVLKVINLAKDFSPVDSLSTGRSISWLELGQAFAQVVLLLGGPLCVFGIVAFTRRELATAQGTQ